MLVDNPVHHAKDCHASPRPVLHGRDPADILRVFTDAITKLPAS